jgi:diketogulonate reductase-like aldo/keto reductase
MIDRRTFMQIAGAAAFNAGLPSTPLAARDQTIAARPIPRTGELLPLIGLGNSEAFKQNDVPLSRQLLEILARHGGRYVDARESSRYTIRRIRREVEALHDLFIGTYIAAADVNIESGDIAMLRKLQGGRPLDLLQTSDMDDLDTRWQNRRQHRDNGDARYIGVAKSDPQYHDPMMALMNKGNADFVQVNYSLLEPEAAKRLLPMAQDKGVAIVINRPFINGRYFSLVGNKKLPAWAADFDCESWAQFSLKYILSHPAVNCVLTETANPHHAIDNLAAGFGRLPDEKTRQRMLALMRSIA